MWGASYGGAGASAWGPSGSKSPPLEEEVRAASWGRPARRWRGPPPPAEVVAEKPGGEGPVLVAEAGVNTLTWSAKRILLSDWMFPLLGARRVLEARAVAGRPRGGACCIPSVGLPRGYGMELSILDAADARAGPWGKLELTTAPVVESAVEPGTGPSRSPSCRRRHRGSPPSTVLAALVLLEVLVAPLCPSRAPGRSKLLRWKAVGTLALLLALLGAGSGEEGL